MVAAMIISDAICGVKNPYSKVFRPQRCNVAAGIGKLFVDLGESIKGLSKGWLNKKIQDVLILAVNLHGMMMRKAGTVHATVQDMIRMEKNWTIHI